MEQLRAQFRVAVKALEEIGQWSQALQDRVEAQGDGLAMWRGCVALAAGALATIRAQLREQLREQKAYLCRRCARRLDRGDDLVMCECRYCAGVV